MMDFNTSQRPTTGTASKAGWSQAGSGNAAPRSSQASPSQNLSSIKHRRTPLTNKRIKWLAIVTILMILAVIVVRMSYHHIVYAGIDTHRYQAVYLTNDNVYFGRVQVLVNGDVFLTDVFRVQATSTTNSTEQNGDSTSTKTATTASDGSSSGIRLIKPGKELHSPDDTMLIRRSNILFIENLKADGKVTQAIVDYHKQDSAN